MAELNDGPKNMIFMHSTDIAPELTGKPNTPDTIKQTVGVLTEKVLGRMRDKRAFGKVARYRVVLRVEEISED